MPQTLRALHQAAGSGSRESRLTTGAHLWQVQTPLGSGVERSVTTASLAGPLQELAVSLPLCKLVGTMKRNTTTRRVPVRSPQPATTPVGTLPAAAG